MAEQYFTVVTPQKSQHFGDFGAYKITYLVERLVTVEGASQPEMDRRVWEANAVPHPRVEIEVGGNEVVVDLAVWPGQELVARGLTHLAQSAGDVPEFSVCLCLSWSQMRA